MPFCVEKVRKRKSPAAIPSANSRALRPGRNSGRDLPDAVLHILRSICVPAAQKEPSVRVWRQCIARPCPACRDRISRRFLQSRTVTRSNRGLRCPTDCAGTMQESWLRAYRLPVRFVARATAPREASGGPVGLRRGRWCGSSRKPFRCPLCGRAASRRRVRLGADATTFPRHSRSESSCGGFKSKGQHLSLAAAVGVLIAGAPRHV